MNLGAAIRRLTAVLEAGVAGGREARAIALELAAEGRAIDAEDVSRNKAMSKWGGDWLVRRVRAAGGEGEGLKVMTVCNTGSLATSVCSGCLDAGCTTDEMRQGYGTALGLITYLHETGKLGQAYFTQSTPYHQGSR